MDTTVTAELSDCSPVPETKELPENSCRKRRSKPSKGAVSSTERQRYIAMDCEMVGIGSDGFHSALARVTLVDWDGQVILDQYVRPTEDITDYRTYVSGVCESDLLNATMDIPTIRNIVMYHLEGKILVGHALKNDLYALGIRHPWQQIRDTAKYEPFMKVRFDDGILWPRKLKELAAEQLSQDIQLPGRPHSPIEDATTAMELYKKVRCKWEKVMDYKIKKTAEIQQGSP